MLITFVKKPHPFFTMLRTNNKALPYLMLVVTIVNLKMLIYAE